MKALLLLLSAGKFGKLLMTSGTMLLSVFAYALVFGWRYAAGFVGLIFVHEMGHYLAARQRGLDVGAPMFIPFVGAWIELKEQPCDVETEAYVGFAGPLFGTAAALACYFLARQADSGLLLALAYSGFFLNLFNLIPVSPFDGGRITAIISPKLWFFGAPILLGLFFYRPSPLLVLMAVMAAPQVLRAWQHDPDAPGTADYYAAALEQRIAYGVYYIALAGFLAIMSFNVHEMLEQTAVFRR